MKTFNIKYQTRSTRLNEKISQIKTTRVLAESQMEAERELLAKDADIILSVTEIHFPPQIMVDAITTVATNMINQAIIYENGRGNFDHAKQLQKELNRTDMSAFAFKSFNDNVYEAINDNVCELLEVL